MSVLTNLVEWTHLPPTDPWYSFQDAYFDAKDTVPYFGYGVVGEDLGLWEAGCRVESGWDCDSACNDPVRLWNSPNSTYTLQNCWTYPFLTALLANGTLKADHFLLQKYNIVPNGSAPSFPGIEPCLAAYCATRDSSCDNERDSRILSSFYPVVNQTYICYNHPANLNPDIGGIGVITSYIVQITILLTAWLVQSVSRTWVRWPAQLWWSLLPSTRRDSTQRATRLQKRYSFPEHSAALVAALVELQKTQVFFMITVEGASLVALYNATYIQASSWQQLWNNVDLFFFIACSGVDCILLNLVMLQKADKVSNYLLVGSTCSVVVALFALLKAYRIDPKLSAVQISQSGFPECDGINPAQYCLWPGTVENNQRILMTTIIPYIVASGLILGALFAERLKLFIERPGDEKKINVFDWIQKRAERGFGIRTGRMVHHAYALAFFAAECWLLYCNCNDIKNYIYEIPNTGGSTWALGQIIAVAVWVPVLVEYLYLAIGGIEKGSLYRLVAPYHVVKGAQKDEHTAGPAGVSPSPPAATDHDDQSSSAHELLLLHPGYWQYVKHANTWSPLPASDTPES